MRNLGESIVKQVFSYFTVGNAHSYFLLGKQIAKLSKAPNWSRISICENLSLGNSPKYEKGGKALCIEIFITGSIIYMLLYNMYSFNKYLNAYYVEGCVLGPVEQNRLNPFSYL